jgi:hypothetical protein
MKPGLLNIDLDVAFRSDPRAFVERMTEKALVLTAHKYRAGYFVRVELNDGPTASVEKKLRAFCRILENLPPAATGEWRNARTRVFDIGLASGDESPLCALDISTATLSRVAQLNAGIAITLYPQFEYDDSNVDSH